MPKPPALKPREVISALERLDFFVHHQSGAHVVLRHVSDPTRRVTVPRHNRDLKTGTLRAILGQAGITVDRLLEAL